MEIIEIAKRKWILSNVSTKTFQKDVYEFMKSLNCACHVAKYDYMATTPLTMQFEIVQDL